jgi:hypothetical protein
MSYTIVEGRAKDIKNFIQNVNSKIQEGYTPLGGLGIETIVDNHIKKYETYLYQAVIKSPVSAPPALPSLSDADTQSAATTTSSSASEPEIKKVESYTDDTLMVDRKNYHLNPSQMVYDEKGTKIGDFLSAYKTHRELFDKSKPNFYVKIKDFYRIKGGGSKSTSRKSYKKYTKKSSSRRHKNRK